MIHRFIFLLQLMKTTRADLFNDANATSQERYATTLPKSLQERREHMLSRFGFICGCECCVDEASREEEENAPRIMEVTDDKEEDTACIVDVTEALTAGLLATGI